MTDQRPKIGAVVRKRRLDLRLEIEQVEALSGLLQATIADIETEARPPTLTELSRLSGALAFDASRALNDLEAELDNPARQVGRFNAVPGTALTPLDVRLLARAAEFSRVGGFLWRQLARPRAAITSAREVKAVRTPRGRVFREGYALGQAARYLLAAVPREPLHSVQGALEGWGVHVAFVEFQTLGINGVSLFEPEALPVILLNTRSERVRDPLARRSVMAHELCHLLHDGHAAGDLLTRVSREDDADPLEQRANAFAPNFLAPGDWVGKPSSRSERLVTEIASKWGLRFRSAAWHAKNLRLISAREADRLQETPGEVEWTVDFETEVEHADARSVDFEGAPSPLAWGLIGDLSIEAASRGLISYGRAREVLSFR